MFHLMKIKDNMMTTTNVRKINDKYSTNPSRKNEIKGNFRI